MNDADSHKAFAQRHGLVFQLLSDLDGSVARAYGSLRDFGVFRTAKRHTFLFNPEGRIARVYLDIVANIELVAPASGANNQSIPATPEKVLS